MMLRLLFPTLLTMSCALAAAWTIRLESAAGRDKVLKFAYLGAATDARHQSAIQFKYIVESESHGILRVELFPGGQLGGDRDAIEGVKLETIDMTVAGAGIFANFEPKMGVTALPYLFDGFEQAWAYNDSKLNSQVSSQLLRHGMRVLAYWDNGFRCVTNSVRPIRRPDDLWGLKIRTPENPIILATISALGASPNPLPWTELYMALQQGAFDGQENPIPTIYVNKLYETQSYLAITNHVYEPMPVVISESVWNRLTLSEQQVIQRAARKSQAFNRRLVQRMTHDMLRELEAAGMNVTRPNLAPFRDQTAGVRRRFQEILGHEFVEEVDELIKNQQADESAAQPTP